MTDPNNVNGDFHEIELLLTKYLWSVMPPEMVREIHDRNERLWEELRLELNGKQIMLMCFKYRKLYNYQKQATSIMDINNLEYYGDNHMDAWLRAVKDIVFHSHDCDVCKIDNTEKGQNNMRFFRDEVYHLMKKSGKMRRWIVDYEKAMPNNSEINTLDWLLNSMQKQIDLDLHFANEKHYSYSRLNMLDPRSKEEKQKQKNLRKGDRGAKDAAPAPAEEKPPKKPRRERRPKGDKDKGDNPDAAPAPKAEAKAKADPKHKGGNQLKAKDAVNAKKGTEISQKKDPILVKHKTKNGKEVVLNLQNECGYLHHAGEKKCRAHEKKECKFSHNYDLSEANKKKVPKPPGLEKFLQRLKVFIMQCADTNY